LNKCTTQRQYIKRRVGGCGLVKLESAYNAAIVDLSEYIKEGKDTITRLVQNYDARKAKYSLQKEANLRK
jgi:hypothetical protein